jgi:hypothetical protein
MVQARFLMFQPKHSGYKVRKNKKKNTILFSCGKGFDLK